MAMPLEGCALFPCLIKKIKATLKFFLVLQADVREDIPMFSTGSGQPVLVNKSSLENATAVLDSHSGKLTSFFSTPRGISEV